jgi:hydrocephalus-inducing protein
MVISLCFEYFVFCGFSFVLENCDPSNPEVSSLFSVIPAKATLSPVDRPTQVQIIFRSPREMTVRDQPILKCHVIEPSLGSGGEIIANIPIKISVKAVFSKSVKYNQIYKKNNIK